jgi:hypothetical protein
MKPPFTHQDLVTAYLLAMAGMPLSLPVQVASLSR